MESFINTLFIVIMYSIWLALILAHSWGFWRVYKQPIKNADVYDMILRGAAAGLTGWFWFCMALTFWNLSNGGGFMMIIWFYLLLFVPILGAFFTVLIWGIINHLNLNLGFFSRALLGLIFGIVAGAVVGSVLDYRNNNENYWSVITLICIFGSIVPLTAITAGEKRLK